MRATRHSHGTWRTIRFPPRHADIIDNQSQSLIRDPEAFRSFVVRTARQSREANPDVEVFGEITTLPLGTKVSAQQMLDGYRAVGDAVDGYYLGAYGNRDRVREVTAFLDMRERARAARNLAPRPSAHATCQSSAT